MVAEAHDTHHPVALMDYYDDQKPEAARAAKQFREDIKALGVEFTQDATDLGPVVTADRGQPSPPSSRPSSRRSPGPPPCRADGVLGHPVDEPETIATAIRIGNPASWHQALAARDESGGAIASVSSSTSRA